MYLEKIEISGFKSFANKTILDFKPTQKNKTNANISAIVGPNGSGKSNVVDAVRWVMGEQSLKLLRGKKGEDVIFSGSHTKARLGFAEVSLYLNNDDGSAPIDYPEIIITRKVYRNGENEYLINKKNARLLDINLLLSQIGFGQKTYSIIGQGMIDYFVLASPQERKEFFEEATGIKPYQIKKEQAINKLVIVENNLENANLQIKEIEPRLRSLTRQVNKLSKREEIEKELKNNQKKYYASLWQELSIKQKEENIKLKDKLRQENILKDVLKNIQDNIFKLTKNSDSLDHKQIWQEEYQKLFKQKTEFEAKLINLKNQAANINNNKIKTIPVAVVEEVLFVLENWISVYSNLTKEKENKKGYTEIQKDWENIYVEIKKSYEKLKPFFVNNTSELNEINIKIEELLIEIKKINDQIAALSKQLKEDGVKEREERETVWLLQQEFQNKQQGLNLISSDVNNIRIEIARIETKMDDLGQEIKKELVELFSEITQNKNEHIFSLSETEKREQITIIAQLKHQLELIGGIDPEIKFEYEQTQKRYDFLKEQSSDLQNATEVLISLVDDLNKNILADFEKSFKLIDEYFEEYFKILFNGGNAKLQLLKKEDLINEDKSSEIDEKNNLLLQANITEAPWEKIIRKAKEEKYLGIDIQATPPGKKLKSINMLSGGERALTSIALICAVISANPSPFVVLDEVDAALDEGNSLRFAQIIEKIASKTQFIIITHNRATMEKAEILYGITMGDDGISRPLSLKFEKAVEYTNR